MTGSSCCFCLLQISIWGSSCCSHSAIHQSYTVGNGTSSWTSWCILAFLFYIIHAKMDIQAGGYGSICCPDSGFPYSRYICSRTDVSGPTRESVPFLEKNTEDVSIRSTSIWSRLLAFFFPSWFLIFDFWLWFHKPLLLWRLNNVPLTRQRYSEDTTMAAPTRISVVLELSLI